MRVRSVVSVAIIAGTALLPVSSAQAVTGHSPIGGGTDVVMYECESAESVETVRIKVELTMPTDAQVGKEMKIGWRGSYDGDARVSAPAGGLNNGNLYAYVSISGLQGLTSATGVGALPSATYAADQPISLPSGTVELKTTPNRAGTATVKPAAINFGTQAGNPSIECEVLHSDALRSYTLTIREQGTSPTPTPSSTPSSTPSNSTSASPRPTATVTRTVTAKADTDDTDDTDAATGASGGVERTPVGAAATGGGGDAGPDARLITLTGLALTLAGVGGLMWRQRRLRRT